MIRPGATGANAESGRAVRRPVLVATAVVVSLAVGAGGALLFTHDSGSGAAPTTSLGAKGATLDTTTTTTVAPTTTTTLVTYSAVADPDAPADVNLDASVTTLPDPPGEPFIADPPSATAALGLTSATPSVGAAGTTVRLAGSGLDRVTSVSFNGVAAESFTALSSTELMVTVPVSATSGPIRLGTDSGEAVSGASFAVSSPSISGIAAQLGTPQSFGSARFDGASGTYLNAGVSADWAIGTRDFTVEWFQYQMLGRDSNPRAFTMGTYPYAELAVSTDEGVVRVWVDGSIRIAYTPPNGSHLNQWLHYAITRSAGVLNLYINGVRVGSTSNTTDIQPGSLPLLIGSEASYSEFTGYMSNFHFVNGTALYTGSTLTVPGIPLAPVANSKLLLRFASSAELLVDSSSARRTVTVNKGVVYGVVPAAGTTPTFGAARFDGEPGSYLMAPPSTDWNIRRGDFTVEWFQYQTTGTDCCGRIFTLGTYPWVALGADVEDRGLRIRLDSSWAIIYPLGGYMNRWLHVAVTRSAGVLSLYVNGTRVASLTYTNDIYFEGPMMIGAEISGSSTISEFPGEITNLHYVNGTALYTGPTLTVPTGPIQPVANTKLLLRFASPDEFLTDSSPSHKTITAGRAFYVAPLSVGGSVTITGTNLTGATSVSFGGVETTPSSVTATSITATVPPGARSGPVTVRTPNGTVTSSTSVSVLTPTIRSVSPSDGVPGTTVTITGVDIGRATSVTFGGVASSSVTLVSPTMITATVPSGAYSGNIVVTTPAGSIVSGTRFVVSPRYTSLNVTRQEPGKTVVFTGVNLAETTSVTFAGSEQLADFSVLSSTQLSITVPEDATNGPITVRNAAGSAQSATFTVAPVVTDLVPSAGPAGTLVSIRGAGFVSGTTVKYGATSGTAIAVTATVVSSREITFTVPAGATGSPLVFVGALTTGPTFTVAANPTVDLGGTGAGASVSAATPSGGTTSTAAALVGATSVALGGGLSVALTSTSLVGGVLQGTGTASLGSFQFPSTLSYTAPGTWTLSPSSPSATGRMRLGSSDVSITTWSGSIAASGGTTTWTLRGKVVASSPIVSSKVVIAGAEVRPVPTCPDYATTAMCASAPTAYVRVEAPTTYIETATVGATLGWTANALGLEVNLGSGMPSMSPSNRTLIPFRSVLNPVSGAFVLQATFDRDTAAQLGGTRAALMRSMRLTMANGDAAAKLAGSTAVSATGTLGGFNVLVSGRGQISLAGIGSWNVTNVASVFTDAGVAVTGDVPSAGQVAELAMASFGYVRMDTTVTINTTVVQVPANTFVLTGSILSPTFLTRYGIGASLLDAYALYTENSGVVKIFASLPIGLTLPSVPGFTSSIDSVTVGLELPLDPALANPIATLSGQGTITPRGRGPIAVTVQGTYDFIEATSTLSLSATGADGNAVWANVFGVSGFDLNSFAVQVGTTETFPYVSAGLLGTGTVPQALRSYMGVDTSRTVPVSFTANLSTETPCLEVTVGTRGSNDPILALPPATSVLTATYATIRASVDGCRVGTIAAVSEVAPGVEVAIAGSLLGSPVSFYGKFDPTPVGPYSTPTFVGWTDVRMTNIPGFAFDASYRFSEAAGGWTLFPKSQVRGGVRIGSNLRIALSGSCEVRVTGPRCDQSGSGAINLAGFKMNMDISVQGWGTPNVVYSGSAGIRVGGVRMTLAGTFGTAGVLESSTMDNPGLIYAFSASGRFGGPLIDSFSVSIAKAKGATVLPTGTLSVSGNLGGVFAQSSGSTRWGGSTTFSPTMSNVSIPASFTIPIGSVNVPVKLKFRLCLTGTCAGTVTPSLDVNFTFLRQPISLSDIPVDPTTWDFAYRLQTSISKSGRAGDSWGGIKGTVTSSIDFSISTSSISLNSTSASAKAYIGIGGSWNYVGTVGVSFNGSNGEYCFSASGKKLCV